MKEGPDIARLAALIGDPARANMLVALMNGGARTVSELAAEAGIGLPTASAHLAKLQEGGLIAPRKSGRHRYIELASERAALLLEQLMGFAGGDEAPAFGRTRPGPRDPELRRARVCYHHLAGDRGVQLYDSLLRRGFLAESPDGLTLTGPGWDFAAGFGIGPGDFAGQRPPHCRACLDWSVRRNHLGGRLGRTFLAAIEARAWATRIKGTRIMRFTPTGERAFDLAFPADAGDDRNHGQRR